MDGHMVLRETAGLIERGWCCGAEARDCGGEAVVATDPAAASWSLLGALVRVSERPNADRIALRDALWGIAGVIPDARLEAWNDAHGRTQDDTLRMLGRARASLAETPPPADWDPG